MLDTFCIKALKDLLSLADKDDTIARYIWDGLPACYIYARYSDWFKEYIDSQRQVIATTANANNYSFFQARIKALEKAVVLYKKFEEKTAKFAEEQKAEFEARDEESFKGVEEQYMGYQNDEIIAAYPVPYLIGR